MGHFDENKYNDAKNIGVKFFEKNKKIRTNCLGNVHFNSDGFLHLMFKHSDKKNKRDWKNQVKRFHLLCYVIPVLRGMEYWQEYSEYLEKVKVKKKGQISYENKLVKYWAFVAIIRNDIRIKIILKKSGEGNIHFWSIIPIWKTQEYNDIKIISLHKGNPQED